jgi:hypothetical protein
VIWFYKKLMRYWATTYLCDIRIETTCSYRFRSRLIPFYLPSFLSPLVNKYFSSHLLFKSFSIFKTEPISVTPYKFFWWIFLVQLSCVLQHRCNEDKKRYDELSAHSIFMHLNMELANSILVSPIATPNSNIHSIFLHPSGSYTNMYEGIPQVICLLLLQN